MKTAFRILGGAAALALSVPSAASAGGYNQWRVCGGLVTACALVKVAVSGHTVTIRVWNLAGNTAGTWGTVSGGGTIINQIGFYNISPTVVGPIPRVSVAPTGPIRPGDNTPQNWLFMNNGSTAGFAVDVSGRQNQNVTGIASGCGLPLLPQTPALASNPNFWLNPCNTAWGNNANYVTFTFQLDPSSTSWNPHGAGLAIRYFNTPTGGSTECFTANRTQAPGLPGVSANCFAVVPEPMTVTLLATGLVGLAGAGFIRRRRQGQQVL